MNKVLKIGLTITFIIIVTASIFIWRFLGKPYYQINLIGTEYIENSDELNYVNEQLDDDLYLIKKYKYSKDKLLIGFGGGNSVTDDYYGLGIADANKQSILKPNYEFIYAKKNHKTKAVYIHCVPYRKTGLEPDEFYKIENNKAILLPNQK